MDHQHRQRWRRGGGAHQKRVVAVDQRVEALKEHPPDIVLCAEDGASLGPGAHLGAFVRSTSRRRLFRSWNNGADIVAYMQKGAAVLVSRGHSEHLKLVVACAALE
jgi:hypothetical protein